MTETTIPARPPCRETIQNWRHQVRQAANGNRDVIISHDVTRVGAKPFHPAPARKTSPEQEMREIESSVLIIQFSGHTPSWGVDGMHGERMDHYVVKRQTLLRID